MTNDEILDRILAREGGYVNHPHDRGRATKYGITAATLSGWRGHDATAAEVAALTEAEAREIYQTWYLEPFKDLPDALREQVVDIAVHSGKGVAKTLLKRADHDPVRLVGERIRYLARVVQAHPTSAVFLPGWVNRALLFLEPAYGRREA